jgi:hypothetical protein
MAVEDGGTTFAKAMAVEDGGREEGIKVKRLLSHLETT